MDTYAFVLRYSTQDRVECPHAQVCMQGDGDMVNGGVLGAKSYVATYLVLYLVLPVSTKCLDESRTA